MESADFSNLGLMAAFVHHSKTWKYALGIGLPGKPQCSSIRFSFRTLGGHKVSHFMILVRNTICDLGVNDVK